jgi:hypothetical protein
MLSQCAAGFAATLKEHRVWIAWNGMIWRGLPKGGHGSRDHEVEVGQVRKMVRFFQLDEACVNSVIEGICKSQR